LAGDDTARRHGGDDTTWGGAGDDPLCGGLGANPPCGDAYGDGHANPAVPFALLTHPTGKLAHAAFVIVD
jgi:hypothetical protein